MSLYHQRWYDDEPRIAEALAAFATFPEPLQLVLATYINQMVSQQRQKTRLTGRHDKVGQHPIQHILGLYQAGLKRRRLDKHPTIRRAINAIRLMTDPQELAQIITRILDIHYFLQNAPQSETEVQGMALDDLLSDIFNVMEDTQLDRYYQAMAKNTSERG